MTMLINLKIMICVFFLWQLILRVTGLILESEKPPLFPPQILIRLGTFVNWSKEINVTNIWITTPRNPAEVVSIVNWAYKNGYRVRPMGCAHGFSPLLVTENDRENYKTILVETTKYLKKMQMTTPIALSKSVKGVKAQTGATMEDVLLFAERNGCGMFEVPAPGKITIGGVLAVGAHGAGIPAFGNIEPKGLLAGTISNLIISLTAVVWNPVESKYVLKTFVRSDPDTKAFLIHLGRSFITEVTLMVGDNYNLRCESFFDIDSKELYADPDCVKPKKRTFSSYLNKTGRIDVLSFGNTGKNWIKLWTLSPTKPLKSRKVHAPYNYPLNNLPQPIPEVYSQISKSVGPLTPVLALAQYAALSSLTVLTLSNDIWGKSKNTMLYVEPETLREAASGHVIITKRENVQKVVSILAEIYETVQNDYAKLGQYPISGHMETRVTYLDRRNHGDIPSLSPIRPIPNLPDYDLAVWLAITSQINQLGLHEAMTKIESRIFEIFPINSAETNPIGIARVEWTKGFAYTKYSGWSNVTVLKQVIPATYPRAEWNYAIDAWERHDPHYTFSNAFLRKYFVRI